MSEAQRKGGQTDARRGGRQTLRRLRRPRQDAYRPFCSKRCADVDLNRWLGEHYRIPTEEPAAGDPEDNGGYS